MGDSEEYLTYEQSFWKLWRSYRSERDSGKINPLFRDCRRALRMMLERLRERR